MTNDLLSDVLFIGGHRKSGTSMVRDLFDEHPALCCYPTDLTALYAYYPQFVSEHDDPVVLKERLERVTIRAIEMKHGQDEAVLPDFFLRWREKLQKCLNTKEELEDIAGVVRALLRSYQSAYHGVTNFEWSVVKETSIEVYAHDLLRWFPSARFIQVVRDPRDNFAALKAGVERYYGKFGEDEKVTLFSLLNRLGTGLRAGLYNRELFGEGRYRILRFEDLVNEPRTVMRDVAAWLGIDFSESLLVPTKWGQATRGNNFEGKDFSKISNSHVGAWRKRIAPEEAQVIEFYLSDLMAEYGYSRAFSQGKTLESVSNFYKWANYKYFYFDSFANEEPAAILDQIREQAGK